MIFSEKHPSIGNAFNVFSGHLADGAIQFMNSNIGTTEQQLKRRAKKQKKFDQKLISAKSELIKFANSLPDNQSMPMDYLLQ